MSVSYTGRIILIYMSSVEKHEIWIVKKMGGYCTITDGIHIFNYIPDQNGSDKIKKEILELEKVGLINKINKTDKYRLTIKGQFEATEALEELNIDISNDPKEYLFPKGLSDDYWFFMTGDGSKVYYKVDISRYEKISSKYGTNDRALRWVTCYPEIGNIKDLQIEGSVEEMTTITSGIVKRFWDEEISDFRA